MQVETDKRLSITTCQVGQHNCIQVKIEDSTRSQLIIYTEEEFTRKIQLLALRDAHPLFYGLLRLVYWIILITALWIIYGQAFR